MSAYYVIRDKNTGLYFRGKGVNRWGKYYNQASIYRVKGQAEHNIKCIAWRGGEQAEIVPIQIVECSAEVAEVKYGEWQIVDSDLGWVDGKCSACGYTDCFDENGFYEYCPNCGAKMDGERRDT